MFELKEPTTTNNTDYTTTGEVQYISNVSQLSLLNFRHPAGVRQPHDMKTRQRWILLAFTLVAGIVLLLMCTGGIKQSPALASPISMTLDLESLTDREKCPACFGVKMCPQIITKKIKLVDWTKYKVTKFANQKNIFYGEWDDGVLQKKVILKKLAHDHELDALDRAICDRHGKGQNCDVSDSVRHLIEEYSHHSSLRPGESILHGEKIGNGSDILFCPSHDKMEFLVDAATKFNKGQHKKTILANVLTTILVNSEPVILEAFTSANWPFPILYGACGRMVVEEYVGKPLSTYIDEPFRLRAYLALQLLKMANLFYENPTKFILYLTDPQADNFAVTENTNIVKLVDLENLIIVDKNLLIKSNVQDADKMVESESTKCEEKGRYTKDCFSFSVDDLCNRPRNDHNYYAICAGLLAPGGLSYDFPQGLLHSIPADDLLKLSKLQDLLMQCKNPKIGKFDLNRIEAAQSLIEILKNYTDSIQT